jgi:hypothetical protein
MPTLTRKTCLKCKKPALPGRRTCYQCLLAKRRESKAKRELIKQKKKARHEMSEGYRKVLYKKAWTLFSKAVRSETVDSIGRAECFTCGIKMPPENLQAGHYFHGRLDFDKRNVHPQCQRCNKWLHGNLAHYGVRLEIEGIDLKVLRRDAEIKGNNYSIAELHEIIEKYKV